MWCDTQENPFIMGLRGTAIKRKLSEAEGGLSAAGLAPPQNAKAIRTDEWDSDSGPLPTPPTQYTTTTLMPMQRGGGNNGYQCYNGVGAVTNGGGTSPIHHSNDDYHQPSCYEVQQTIRCDENGKSYLDLGSWSTRNSANNSASAGRCCEGRTSWCSRGPSCYRQRRLAVLNISMCKLGRYRQFSDPSLHRSVLICNTLRLIEKEMEQEGYFSTAAAAAAASTATTTTTTTSSASPGGGNPPNGLHPSPSSSSSSGPPSDQAPPLHHHHHHNHHHHNHHHHQQFPEVPVVPYEPPRVPTPFPPAAAASDSEDDRSINWGSVLSLSSQSDLDPLNNNDCLGDSDLSHDLDDFLPSWKMTDDSLRPSAPPRASDSGELENIMHVLVGT